MKNTQVESEEAKIVQKELQIFVEAISQSVDLWIDIAMNTNIRNETDIIVIDAENAILKIYESILKTVNCKIEKSIILSNLTNGKLSGNFNKDEIDFSKKFMNECCETLIIEILRKQGKILEEIYKESQEEIKGIVNEIDNIIKRKELMNSYILFAMLKQMISNIDNKIQKKMKRKFPQISRNKIKEFCKFIEKNCEILSFKIVDHELENEIEKNNFSNQNETQLTNTINNENLKFSKEEIDDSEEMLLLQKNENEWDKNTISSVSTKQESNNSVIAEKENISENKIPEKSTTKNMKLLEQNNSINDVCDSLESEIEFSGNTASYILPTDEYATIGGNIGKCLADINEFRNASQFFLELSKTTALCGTIGYAVTKIPMLTYFILAGGFSYSYYLTLSNEFLSPFKKVNQIGCSTMTALGTIGSTMSGIFIGQIAIPVPILGAFVGGVCGGYFGTKTMRKINNFLSKTNFREIIQYLKKTILTDRHWLCTNNLIQKIGISEEHLNTLTVNQEEKDIFMTAICFIIVSFYESNRHSEFNELKLQEMKENKTECEKFFSKEKTFSNEFDLVKIIEYLSENNFSVIDQIDELKGFMSHLIY